ncbi:hypothetical protein BJV78DRAFT_1284954 [Lactifluus subvellereus]|nr:hypothetical protein BJV78DRAFT_1284954 [Lactifluus subvellereus]
MAPPLANPFLMAIVFALSALAIPIAARGLASSPDRPNPNPSHMTPKLIFDIVFGLLFFMVVLTIFLCVAGYLSVAPLADMADRIRAAPRALIEMWRSLRLARLLEGAATPIVDGNGATNGAPTMQGGGISNPIPTASYQVPCNEHGQDS